MKTYPMNHGKTLMLVQKNESLLVKLTLKLQILSSVTFVKERKFKVYSFIPRHLKLHLWAVHKIRLNMIPNSG